MSGRYDDIIGRPRPLSQHHAPMKRAARAAQFAPFAALQGYEDAVKEAGRLTVQRRELDEDEKQLLDRQLQVLICRLAECSEDPMLSAPHVILTCFVADARKKGGHYEVMRGILKKVDSQAKMLVLADGRRIPAEDITALREDTAADTLHDEVRNPGR
ncbi:MAG: hypothetical protein PUC26_07960 [Eubacteriales bacterium]|nr:hypothetical protein [Eubacteriales bacterium]